MATRDISDLQVVLAYREAERRRDVWPYDVLMAWTGQPFKVCRAAMQRADRRGFIDYGTSLRSGWVTPEGEALLEGRA